jgi:hypothetical protein
MPLENGHFDSSAMVSPFWSSAIDSGFNTEKQASIESDQSRRRGGYRKKVYSRTETTLSTPIIKIDYFYDDDRQHLWFRPVYVEHSGLDALGALFHNEGTDIRRSRI